MPETSKTRLRRISPVETIEETEIGDHQNGKHTILSQRDFEYITNKIKNKVSGRPKDAELRQQGSSKTNWKHLLENRLPNWIESMPL